MGLEAKVKPDSSKEVSKVYALRDDSADVEIEISEFASFCSDKLNYTVELIAEKIQLEIKKERLSRSFFRLPC